MVVSATQFCLEAEAKLGHCLTSFLLIACSLFTHCAKAKSGPPLSPAPDAPWAMPWQTGLRLSTGTWSDQAAEAKLSRKAIETLPCKIQRKYIVPPRRE